VIFKYLSLTSSNLFKIIRLLIVVRRGSMKLEKIDQLARGNTLIDEFRIKFAN
jgi:hypothetical protein